MYHGTAAGRKQLPGDDGSTTIAFHSLLMLRHDGLRVYEWLFIRFSHGFKGFCEVC
jgi:hypothetical protein